MKRIVFTLVIFMFCTAGTAHALQGFYVAPKLGYSLLNFDDPQIGGVAFRDRDDGVWGGGLAVGWDMGRAAGPGWAGVPLRIELEGFWRERAEETFATPGVFIQNRAEVLTLFGNAFLDIPLGWAFTPYVGAGVGLAWVDYRTTVVGPEFATVRRRQDQLSLERGRGSRFHPDREHPPRRQLPVRGCRNRPGQYCPGLGRSESDIYLHEFLAGIRLAF
jgi:opacity protein-like surface antigen